MWFLIKGSNSLRFLLALFLFLLVHLHCSIPFKLKLGVGFGHLSICLSDTGSGQDPQKGRADFCFQRTAGNFDGKFLHSKRQGPDPAHLRVLWWNNSKCLSCIVWHAAGGALKPHLPTPKAPLNKIVKNNSFTLIFPSDYCTQGGKLAADPCASFFFDAVTYLFVNASFSLSCLSSPSISLLLLIFLFPVSLSLISLCGRPDELSVAGGGAGGVLLGQY